MNEPESHSSLSKSSVPLRVSSVSVSVRCSAQSPSLGRIFHSASMSDSCVLLKVSQSLFQCQVCLSILVPIQKHVVRVSQFPFELKRFAQSLPVPHSVASVRLSLLVAHSESGVPLRVSQFLMQCQAFRSASHNFSFSVQCSSQSPSFPFRVK